MNKIKWASVRITSSESVVLSLDSGACFYFETAEQFTEAIRKKQIKAKNWAVSVPDSLCITKTIELPASDTEQAYQMLEFELSSLLPLAAEDLVYGCVPISQGQGLLKVLAYILKARTLEEILLKYRSIGVRSSRVMVDSVVIDRFFRQDTNSGDEQVNLLFGKKFFYISVSKDSISGKNVLITENNDNLAHQQEKVKEKLYHFTEDLFDDNDSPVLKIAADNSVREELKCWFEGSFNTIDFLELPTCRFFRRNENIQENAFIVESVITQGLVEAVGDTNLTYLNLLPKKTLKKAWQRQLFIDVGICLGLGVLTVFCLWLNFAAMNWRIQRACRRIIREITPIEHIAADVESKRQQVRAIQTQLANRHQIRDIFSEFYQYSPKQISISQLSYSAKADTASVSIKGQSDTLSDAFEYSSVMKDSKLLNNIQIINAQQVPKPGGSVVEFKAECTVKEN